MSRRVNGGDGRYARQPMNYIKESVPVAGPQRGSQPAQINGERTVFNVLKLLSDQIAEQEKILEELTSRLSPVLEPKVLEPGRRIEEDSQKPLPPTVCELAITIGHELNRVMAINGSIQNLIGRLEI